MLKLPETGFRPSVGAHNVDFETICDWIEASVLFVDERLSKIDVVDVLLEENVYQEQDFAKAFIDDVWAFINRRQQWLGRSAALGSDGEHLIQVRSWRELPGHSFCLVLALRRFYRAWSTVLGPGYVTQGDLFEKFAAEALKQLGWEVYRTGWVGITGVRDYQSAVLGLADVLRERAQLDFVNSDLKDKGLDLVCHKSFQDARGGHPVFLVQCASGRNWEEKLGTPSLDAWRDVVRFTGSYSRGIAMPFNIPDDDTFREKRLAAAGVFWDRYRLLAAGRSNLDWMSPELAAELIAWIEPAVQVLPAA